MTKRDEYTSSAYPGVSRSDSLECIWATAPPASRSDYLPEDPKMSFAALTSTPGLGLQRNYSLYAIPAAWVVS